MLFGGTGKVRIAKFAEAYQADLQEQETESWKQAEQLGILKFESSAGPGSIFARDYPVDTTFVRTLECLEEMGVTVKRIQDMDVAAITARILQRRRGMGGADDRGSSADRPSSAAADHREKRMGGEAWKRVRLFF